MKSLISIIAIYFFSLLAASVFAQDGAKKKVIITGVRFAYPLVEKWIHDYHAANPQAEVSIEARSTSDPAGYDLLIEAYEPDNTLKETREYLFVARYAILPVANSKSPFAGVYAEKGLTADLLKQVYFNDIFVEKRNENDVQVPYTIYTRLQSAGAPITFSKYFGYSQGDINGKAVGGADEHLVKALLKDTTGVSYNVPALLFNLQSRKPVDGLTIIPVDTDGNGRVTRDEKFYTNLDQVLALLERDVVKNIPVEYLHISISKKNSNDEALKFLQWVSENSQETLHQFGFLQPEAKRFEQDKAKFDVASN